MRSAIILCGGKATRMGDLCESTPKVLMKIGDKTILEHQIELLRKSNIHRVILAVGHLMNCIKEEVGNSCRGVEILYSEESEPLGTAGAFKNAFSYLDDEEMCFGLNGDIFMPDFQTNIFEKTSQCIESDICVSTFSWTPPFGIVKPLEDGDRNFGTVSEFIEKKPVMVNAGFYIIKPQARPLFPNKGSIEYDVFEKGAKCSYYLYNGVWFDCGTPERLDEVNEYINRK